jgi:DNA-binding MarR family transcriptional regulator
MAAEAYPAAPGGNPTKIVSLVNDLAASQIHTDVANRLRPALLKLARELRRESHALGVTGGQVTLLIQIHRNRGIGVNELAARERISAPAMSKHVARLEAAGLVRRTQDEQDGRRRGLSVTDEGERVLRSVKSRRTAWLAARLKQLEPEELEAIDAAIEPLVQLLEHK